ncbi:hypothetical protein FJY90_03735 [Candidatus Gottesmanbacteria bacterium]|nr:hypothetical protein [Candidatus Gottesmanbacteria bacterium]
MWVDPLVEEIRKRRRELMAEFDYDPRKVLKNLKEEKGRYSEKMIRSNSSQIESRTSFQEVENGVRSFQK